MDLGQIFENSFDCYTQVDKGDGVLIDEMAISKEKLIEIVSNLHLKQKEEIIPNIQNKLSPFWNLIEMLLIDDEDLPEDAYAYSLLIQKEAFKCRDNQKLILRLLDFLSL